jgi:hypothetical protein
MKFRTHNWDKIIPNAGRPSIMLKKKLSCLILYEYFLTIRDRIDQRTLLNEKFMKRLRIIPFIEE